MWTSQWNWFYAHFNQSTIYQCGLALQHLWNDACGISNAVNARFVSPWNVHNHISHRYGAHVKCGEPRFCEKSVMKICVRKCRKDWITKKRLEKDVSPVNEARVILMLLVLAKKKSAEQTSTTDRLIQSIMMMSSHVPYERVYVV